MDINIDRKTYFQKMLKESVPQEIIDCLEPTLIPNTNIFRHLRETALFKRVMNFWENPFYRFRRCPKCGHGLKTEYKVRRSFISDTMRDEKSWNKIVTFGNDTKLMLIENYPGGHPEDIDGLNNLPNFSLFAYKVRRDTDINFSDTLKIYKATRHNFTKRPEKKSMEDFKNAMLKLKEDGEKRST